MRDPVSEWQTPKKTREDPDPDGRWVQTDPGETDKRLLVLQPEFAAALKVAKREGNTLSTVIRELWDTGNVATLTKNDPVTATNAHVSIIGHITRDELRRELTATETINGFANRYLWVCVRRSKCLPEALELPTAGLESFADTFVRIIRFSRTVGQMTRDAGATEVWAAVYPELTREEDGLYGAAIARGAPQVLRLSMLYALADFSAVIRKEHLLAALAFWTYADQSARYVFGYSQGNPIADQILQAVAATPDGISRSSVYNISGRHVTRGEVDAALATAERKGPHSNRAAPHWGAPGRVDCLSRRVRRKRRKRRKGGKVSRLLDLARAVAAGRAGRAHDTRGVPAVPPAVPQLEHPLEARSTPLAALGDLAEAINAHLAGCRVCEMEFFVTDTPGPLCPDGLELWRRYRKARLVAGYPVNPQPRPRSRRRSLHEPLTGDR